MRLPAMWYFQSSKMGKISKDTKQELLKSANNRLDFFKFKICVFGTVFNPLLHLLLQRFARDGKWDGRRGAEFHEL